jgi:hypothetical protein
MRTEDKTISEIEGEFINIDSLPGYAIFNCAPWTVRNNATNKNLKPYLVNHYYAVSVKVGENNTKKYMHELVAKQFKAYDKNKHKLIFKDGDIKNYDYDNLDVVKKEKVSEHKISWNEVSCAFIDIKDNYDFNKIYEKYPRDLLTKEDTIEMIQDLRKVFAVVRAKQLIYIVKDFNKNLAYVSYICTSAARERLELIDIGRIQGESYNAWKVYKKYSELFTYDELSFYNKDNPKSFNYFRGYDYDLVEKFDHQIIEPFLDHLKEVICDGNEVIFNYINSWFSMILRDPNCKLTTALVVLGEQGTGKNVFTNVWSDLLGRYACRNISDIDHITGKFNASIENKKLVVCNELQSADNNKYMNSDKLKSIVTDNKIYINQKCEPIREVDNVANFIFVSNNLNPLRIESKDRRYVVLKTSNKVMQNSEYFGKLCATFSKEFYNNLYTFYSREHDISTFNHRKIPETEARNDMIAANAPNYELFVQQMYHKIVDIPTYPLFKMFDKWREPRNYVAVSERTFTIEIKKYTGGAKQKRMKGGGRPYVHNVLPELLEIYQQKNPDPEEDEFLGEDII